MKTKRTPYSDIYKEIEEALWEHDYQVDQCNATPYSYTDNDFRACLKIFFNGLMWKMWEKQVKDGLPMSDRMVEVDYIGGKINNLIDLYTGIDTKKLYDDIDIKPID